MVFLFKDMVPPRQFQATCVSGAPAGPDRVLQGQQKQNQAQEKSPDRAMPNTSAMALRTKPVLLYHIYYYTPLPLNLANIYIYISPLIYTPLPNSRLLHHTALRYVRRVQLGAYMWRKGLKWVKTGSKWAHFTCLCTPIGPRSL